MKRGLSDAFWREAAAWIGADTVTTRSNLAFARRVAARFAPLGFRPRLQKVVEDKVVFCNLLLSRGPAGRPLLLNTHTDTVPPGPPERWTRTGGKPHRLTRRAGRAYGLGVADVKLNLLCQWEALRRVGPVPFRRPLCLAATYGEEGGMRGARRLIQGWRGPKPVAALVGEPSQGKFIHRHRGYLVFRWSLAPRPATGAAGTVLIEGKSAHSSTPHLGVNALEKLFAALEKRGAPVSSFSGGTAHNQVPATAQAAWAESGGLPWREAWARWRRVRAAFPKSHSLNLGVARMGKTWDLTFDLRFPPEIRPEALVRRVKSALRGLGRVAVVVSDPGLAAKPGAPAFRVVTQAVRSLGRKPRWAEKATCTEAGMYDAWGIPALVWGPGVSVGNVHRPNESIAEKDLAGAVDFYERLFRLWAS